MEQRYQTIARQIQAEIDAGTFEEGRMLPTRSALASRFKVARATIDRGVTSLVKKGVLTSTRGFGTVVATRTSVRTIGLLGNYWFNPELPQCVRVERITFNDIRAKADRSILRKFDGLIWLCPDEQEIEWARETPPDQPQLLINRYISGFNYVSIDHGGAIRDITARRLAECPQALPVFLAPATPNGLVWGMREQGFIEACRAASRFYEIVPFPNSFNERLEILKTKFPVPLKQPLIIVTGNLANTGAVIAWVKERGLTWKKNVFYSDFDNEYPADVWGLTVTSFVQDYRLLLNEAVDKTLELITGTRSEAQVLIQPMPIDGDT